MSDAEVLTRVAQETLVDPAELGPNAPRNEAALVQASQASELFS